MGVTISDPDLGAFVNIRRFVHEVRQFLLLAAHIGGIHVSRTVLQSALASV